MTMEVYVVIARTAPQDRLYWVIGVYTDEARAYQVARDFTDLEPIVANRTVDERGIEYPDAGYPPAPEPIDWVTEEDDENDEPEFGVYWYEGR